MEDKIILLIVKVFAKKIVAIIETIMKTFTNYNNGNSLNE